jgi:hypothetical protein
MRSIFGPAKLLRFVQLHVRAWFLKVLAATDHKDPAKKSAWPGYRRCQLQQFGFTLAHTEKRNTGTQNAKIDETPSWNRTS